MPHDAKDYGLDDAELLCAAANLAPTLFASLKLAHELRTALPIDSRERLLAVIYKEGADPALRHGFLTTRAAVEEMCMEFPIITLDELLRTLYVSTLVHHQQQHTGGGCDGLG